MLLVSFRIVPTVWYFKIVQTVWYFFVFHFINHDHGQYNYRVSQSLLAKNVEYVAERPLFTEHKNHN